MGEFITMKTSSPSGDTISFMAGIRQLWIDTGKKTTLYHRLGMLGISYPEAIHPYSDEQGNPVCFNLYTFDMMKPLMLSQPYIEDYLVFNGQEHDWDLDVLRFEKNTLQPRFSLTRWPFQVFPQMNCNLGDEWIDVKPNRMYADKVIINLTERHRNTVIHYNFLREHQEKIVFAGLKKEHELFCKEWEIDVPLFEVMDFLELAQIIKGCKFFLGNQSFAFLLAESLKIPRILEIFPMMPNVITTGDDAYDFVNQGSVEFYFNKLINR